jgi:hypothetical protein
MSRAARQKSPVTSCGDFHVSDEMKHQLKSIAGRGADKEAARLVSLKVVTFDSDLEAAVPDPVVMWSKATCC